MPAQLDVITRGVMRDALVKQLNILDSLERSGFIGRGNDRVKRAGLLAMARVVRLEMRKRVRVRTGELKRKIRVGTRTQNGQPQGFVSVPAPWNILEFGRKAGKGRSRGSGRGRSYGSAPAYPFIIVSVRASEVQQLHASSEAMQKLLLQASK